MKRFTTLLAGSALAAALSFGAQTPAAPATDSSVPATTKKHVKKHKKAKKDAAATTSSTPSATPSAPAKK